MLFEMRNNYLTGLLFIISFFLSACDEASKHSEADHEDEKKEEALHSSDEIVFTESQAKAADLQTEMLKPADFTDVIEVSGRILPAQGAEATIAATMSGIVTLSRQSITDGAAVGAGQTILTISASKMANGNPAATAQAELIAARQAHERNSLLLKEKIISQKKFEESSLRLQKAEATAKSLGKESQTRTVSSPMKGYIKDVLVKTGDYVEAGQPLATVTQNSRIQLRADVPERYFSFLPRITTANFRLGYDENKEVFSVNDLDGRLVSKGQATESNGFSVPIIFEMNNQGRVVSGCFAEVWLKGNVRKNVLSVPNEAIGEGQGIYFVYIQKDKDAYQRRIITLGNTDGRRTEVLSGLKEGDCVVVKGTTQIRLAANSGSVPEGHHH